MSRGPRRRPWSAHGANHATSLGADDEHFGLIEDLHTSDHPQEGAPNHVTRRGCHPQVSIIALEPHSGAVIHSGGSRHSIELSNGAVWAWWCTGW